MRSSNPPLAGATVANVPPVWAATAVRGALEKGPIPPGGDCSGGGDTGDAVELGDQKKSSWLFVEVWGCGFGAAAGKPLNISSVGRLVTTGGGGADAGTPPPPKKSSTDAAGGCGRLGGGAAVKKSKSFAAGVGFDGTC